MKNVISVFIEDHLHWCFNEAIFTANVSLWYKTTKVTVLIRSYSHVGINISI